MMQTPQVNIRPGRDYGLGMYLIGDHQDLPRYEAHGFDAGINAYIAHHPTRDLNLIVLSNIDRGATKIFRAAHDRLVAHAGSGV